LSRPPTSRNFSIPSSFVRVNGKIRAREVRVIGTDNQQLGVLPLNEAITMARTQGVDLVEVAPNATPPVCRLVEYGKYRYEMSKKDKESKKHQHANKVKEVQLSPTIDPHDFTVKLAHAIDFLCEEMKVKVTLKFRGREMAHQEFGFQTVDRFIKELVPFAHPDAPPKLMGRGLNVMLSPLPRNKRAKNPNQNAPALTVPSDNSQPVADSAPPSPPVPPAPKEETPAVAVRFPTPPSHGFANNPFTQLDVKVAQSQSS
jgi:translation initiation factor IF-3